MNTKKKTIKKKAAPKRKAVKKKVAPKRKAAPKKKAAKKPLPKYHLSIKSWDKPAVMDAICEEVMGSSYSLVTICSNEPNFPSAKTVFRWMSEEQRAGTSALCDQYARAKEMQADYLADEMFDIADDGRNDYMEKMLNNGESIEVLNTEHVQRSRLRLDTRKWIASKLKPKKYGDKLELSGDPERPLTDLSHEELDAKIATLLKKVEQLKLS